jgi:hypothetical protein
MDDKRDDKDRLENPLGISDAPIAPDPAAPVRASEDEEEARRRRNRALSAENDEGRSTGMDDVNRQHTGATGIDIGAGRGGTE